MRTVAQWALSALQGPTERYLEKYEAVVAVVDRWIGSKGESRPGGIVVYHDGRKALLETQSITCGPARAQSWKLAEPTAEGRFMTEVSVASSLEELAFSCVLSAGGAEIFAPVSIEVRCPQVVRSVVDLNFGWRVGETAVRTAPLSYRTTAEGVLLADVLRRHGRALPIVIVSEHRGLVLHPGISEDIARELTGLALVATVSDEASWQLSRSLGREWSCYRGAIRLYWPFQGARDEPGDHPLWTSERLLENAANTEEAANRIRGLLRRRLFGLSAFTVEPSRLFGTIRRAAADEELVQRRKLAQEHHDSQDLLELYAQEEQTLRSELENERETNRQLRQDLYNLQARLVWQERGGDLAPSAFSPQPTTVSESVDRARKVLSRFLTFGNDVEAGVASLAPDAGPPEKVFDHLQLLADLAQLRRDGPVGCGMVQWLAQEGVSASGESETIRNSSSEMAKRRWHDGRQDREFELHIKTAEATAPNRCVRIYFDWDDVSEKVVVGWVGRHP